MKVVLLLLVLLTASLVAVNALPGGAPLGACESLTPGHGSNPQQGPSPFSIDMSPFGNESHYYYIPGYQYTLMLNGTGTFRGFLTQSRTIVGDDRVGTFDVYNPDMSQIGPCDPPQSSLTHNSRSDKEMMLMLWTAPDVGTGPIQFAYTVVQVFTTYWVAIRSDTIEEGPSGMGCSLDCDENEVCVVTVNGTELCVCQDGYFYNDNTDSCELEVPTSNCTYLECYEYEMCIVTENDGEVCVCQYGYAFNPNTRYCEPGYVELPIRLDATVLPYNGDCYNLNTTAEREAIDYVVRETLKKSVVYNDYISP